MAVLLSLMMVVSLTPSVALAEGGTTLELSINQCDEIGSYLGESLYLYEGTVPEGAVQVDFTDFEDSMGEDGAIASITGTNQYLEGTNIAPISQFFSVTSADIAEDDNIELDEEYEGYDFTDCYAYFVMDEDGSWVTFIIKTAPTLPDITFTASVKGVAVPADHIMHQPEGYNYIPYGKTEAVSYELRTVIIPEGTDQVDFQFSDKCMAYNYVGKSNAPILVDDNDFNSFIGDFYSDPAGFTEYHAGVDRNRDGRIDAVQIQAPFSSDWNSGGEVLYGITFRYDLFNAFVDGQAMSKVEKTESGYTPYEWDNDAQAMRPGQKKVPLYTVTLPSDAQEVKLEFSEACYPYSYTFDGTYISGYYSEGVKNITAAVDGNQDGEADYIQVQTPYIQNEAGEWVSEVLYAVTFDGVELTEDEPEEITAGVLVHNIAERFAGTGTASHSQAPWLTADMMAYEKAFPNSKNKLTEDQKKAMTDAAIEGLGEAQSAGDAAKFVIALVSVGVDPSALTNALGDPLDGVEILDGLVFDGDAVIAPPFFEYTLPYVLIAYQQLEGTESRQQILVAKALELQEAWMDTQWGFLDGMTSMMLALAPYKDTDEAVQKALAAAAEKVTEAGALNNAASDGLAAAAFTALGRDPAVYVQDLLNYTNTDRNGFGSDINDEQGFRGLMASFLGQGERIYDFSGQDLVPADSSRWNLKFTVVPEDAEVSLKDPRGEDVTSQGNYAYLLTEAGTYTYTVSAEGYNKKTGTITAAEAVVSGEEKIKESVSLTREKPPASSDTVTVTVQVLSHGQDCGNAVTYKNDPDKYSSLLSGESYTATLVKNEGTARDALVEALDDSGITYEEVSNGYFPTIGEYTEFGHGTNSGWLYMVNGKAGTSAMKDVTFSQDGTLTLFYTDDYSRDYGSENWGGGGSGGGNDDSDDPSDQPGPDGYYDDTKGHWAEEAIDSITERGLMNGVAERKFAPDMTLSRAMFVTMLWRLDGEPYEEGTAQAGMNYSDVDGDDWYYKAVLWGVKNDIVKGTSDTTFSPDASLTREQMATFLYRYKNGNGRLETGEDSSASPQNDISAISSYTDADQVSSWAKEAVTWAIANGIINGVSEKKLAPQGTATRAQAATILLRYIDKHSL